MNVTFDPVLGESRKLDTSVPQTKTPPAAVSNSAEIEVLGGGERYEFLTPLKELTITEVLNSPLESEVIFTATFGFTPATEIQVGAETEYESEVHTLTQDDPTATGNARTFSAEFRAPDTDWWNDGQWRIRAYVDPVTRKWTIHSTFSGTEWGEIDPENGEWGEVPYTTEGVFAVAKTADTELEFVEWTGFDYARIPKGYNICDGAFVKTDGGNTPPVITIPETVGIIGTLPDFEGGKRYILNFRDNLVVGAEVR